MKRCFVLISLLIALTINTYSQTQDQSENSSKLPVAETLINYEKQSWEAVKQKDYKFFTDHYADDFQVIFPGRQALTKLQLIEILKTFDLNDYQFGNITVTMLDKNAAVLTYELDEQVSSGGKKFMNHNSITSAWAKRNGKWLCVFFRPFILKSTSP